MRDDRGRNQLEIPKKSPDRCFEDKHKTGTSAGKYASQRFSASCAATPKGLLRLLSASERNQYKLNRPTKGAHINLHRTSIKGPISWIPPAINFYLCKSKDISP